MAKVVKSLIKRRDMKIKSMFGGERDAHSADRRRFFKNVSLGGLGVAGAAVIGNGLFGSAAASVFADEPDPSANDIAILNFALNLEYLEAEYYTVATTGKTLEEIGIPVGGVGPTGITKGGQKVDFTENDGEHNGDQDEDANVFTIAKQIAYDEQQHVLLLRSVLGDEAIAKPDINLDALGRVKNRNQFLAEARAFEDVGVSAYGGAAPLIESKVILATAARIALTEGEHTGVLRLLVALNEAKTMKLDAQDVLPPPSGTDFFSVNKQGLTVVRTVSQVLAIVYGSAKPGTNHGGFFPEGVNGTFKTV
jgi:Ferritin-like domain